MYSCCCTMVRQLRVMQYLRSLTLTRPTRIILRCSQLNELMGSVRCQGECPAKVDAVFPHYRSSYVAVHQVKAVVTSSALNFEVT